MKALDLSTQSTIQLEILQTEQESNIKNITKILSLVDEMCQAQAGMSLDELIDSYDYCIEKLNIIKTEKESREIIKSL